jgi:TorA maturation chaperone TorD
VTDADRELLEFRAGYYDLLVALLAREPTAEILQALGSGIDARVAGARRLQAELGDGWADIAAFVRNSVPATLAETVREEYTLLFVGPPAPQVNPYESFYLTGRVYDRPLAAVRQSLAELGIARRDDVPEPEDFIASECDVVRSLLRREHAARDPGEARRWRDAQGTFLARHLLVWGSAAAHDLVAAPGARFYRGVGRILSGFLALEAELLVEWGIEGPPSLDLARGRFAGSPEWRGPRFD